MTCPQPPTELQNYQQQGWCKFSYDEQLQQWIDHTLPHAIKTLKADENQCWWRYQATWFVGVNVLPNDSLGVIGSGPRLDGSVIRFMDEHLAVTTDQMDQAQISVCFAGYPKPAENESEASYRYRQNRDAAHVDGLLRDSRERHRYAREYHNYILLLPMTEVDVGASPFVVWNGSHRIMRKAIADALQPYPSEDWADTPITDAYQTARREVFDHCQRVELNLKPGEAVLAHRLLLHGTAPWQPGARSSEHGRMLCFFRPQTLTIEEWLSA